MAVLPHLLQKGIGTVTRWYQIFLIFTRKPIWTIISFSDWVDSTTHQVMFKITHGGCAAGFFGVGNRIEDSQPVSRRRSDQRSDKARSCWNGISPNEGHLKYMQDGSCEVASWLGGKPPRKSLVVLPQQPRMMCVFFSFCNLGRKQLCFENLWMPLEVCLTVTSWREAVPFQCDTCQGGEETRSLDDI